MIKLLTALVFTILVMPSFSTALAGDFCITSSTFTLVGKAFKVPSHGKCEPFFGFFADNPGSGTTGRACTASNGSHVDFDLTTTLSGLPSFAQWDNIDLSLPALTGTQSASAALGGMLGPSTSVVTGGPCPTPEPIP